LGQFLLAGGFKGAGGRSGGLLGVANALMLLSVSMVNVILNLLCSALFAVNTWIARKCFKRKALTT
jgi:hypothetical protein